MRSIYIFLLRGRRRGGLKFDDKFKNAVEAEVLAFDYRKELGDNTGSSAPITFSEVRQALSRMGSFKTPGPDEVHPLFLKKGGHQVVRSLTFLFNLSFNLGKLPYFWRLAYITPLPKRRETLIDAFRPISILSILCAHVCVWCPFSESWNFPSAGVSASVA